MMSAKELDGKYFTVLELPELKYILGAVNKFHICFFTSLCCLLELIGCYFFSSYKVFVLMVLLNYVILQLFYSWCTH